MLPWNHLQQPVKSSSQSMKVLTHFSISLRSSIKYGNQFQALRGKNKQNKQLKIQQNASFTNTFLHWTNQSITPNFHFQSKKKLLHVRCVISIHHLITIIYHNFSHILHTFTENLKIYRNILNLSLIRSHYIIKNDKILTAMSSVLICIDFTLVDLLSWWCKLKALIFKENYINGKFSNQWVILWYCLLFIQPSCL